MIDAGAYLDLERLTNELRRASIERSRIPAHSGTADSGTRKARRAARARYTEQIEDLESKIVAWALSTVPVPDNLIPEEE